ncbi:upstream activation factor subunit spp27 [Agrilus planipennis]|uniref:Upstream activation factor subunit spp27 n=1 Tax=Agrilus planipennis TaxID=224129 RepID=A0A7F5REV5_AGRPL|nr:upstream activation factor subunit spp27 [Agrilus planipennis]
MADISKEDLRKEITAILKDADLDSTSTKKVRQQLETKLGANLLSRKKEIDTLVMEYVNSKEKKNDSEDGEGSEEEEDEVSEDEKKGNKRASSGKKPPAKKAKSSEESDASEPSEGESEEEYSPKKSKPPKTRKLPPKKKKGSESDSDEDWEKAKKAPAKKTGGGGGKGGGKGYTKTMTLSPELAQLVGSSSMARHEVVKKVWSIIKERDLYDPKNKQFAICDDDLFKVIGVKRFRTFGMMKYLKNHFVS